MPADLVVAVASGKGGTGKTTVATSLAFAAARRQWQVQYIDCDAEEPNGLLFLVPDSYREEPVTAQVPRIDQSKCTGCGKCG